MQVNRRYRDALRAAPLRALTNLPGRMSALLRGEARARRRAVGGAQPAQRPRRRHHPARPDAGADGRRTRSSASPTGLDGGSIVVSSTNGKTTTAGMIAGILRAAGREPVHNRAGSNMHWGVATALLEQQRRARACSSSTRPGCRGWRRSCARACSCSATSSATSSTATASWSASPTSGRSWSSRLAGDCEFALCADDPLIADLGRDRELKRRPGVTYFGIEDPSQALPELQHAHDAKHCRRCGAPYAYDRAFVGHLGHYTCPNCDADRPAPDVAATAVELRGMSGSRVERARRPRASSTLDLPLPGLYNVYNALAAITAGLRSGVGLEHDPARAWSAMQAVFGRVETIEVDGKPVSILLIKNPAGRQRGAAHAQPRGLERAASTSGSRSTTGSPTAATSPGSGTPTSSCSPAACAAWSAPAPARRRWRCGSSTRAGRRRRSRSATGSRRSLDARRRRAPTGASSRSPPTPPCSSCARCSPTAASRRSTGSERLTRRAPTRSRPRRRSGRTSSSAPTRADLALWEELAGGRGGPVLELGAGAGRVALHLARAGHEVIAVERDPELAARARAARGASCRRSASSPAIAATWPRSRAAGAARRRDRAAARDPAARAGRAAARCSRRSARLLARRRPVALVLVDESSLARAGRAAPTPTARHARGRRLGLLQRAALGPGRRARASRCAACASGSRPSGEIERSVHDELLHRLAPEELEARGAEAGLRAARAARRSAPGAREADSVAVILEAP